MLKTSGVGERGTINGAEGWSCHLQDKTRAMLESRRRRRVIERPSRRRNESVEGGRVETIYSTVVGEGLRTRREGATVNI
jgi:hypothetical protein